MGADSCFHGNYEKFTTANLSMSQAKKCGYILTSGEKCKKISSKFIWKDKIETFSQGVEIFTALCRNNAILLRCNC